MSEAATSASDIEAGDQGASTTGTKEELVSDPPRPRPEPPELSEFEIDLLDAVAYLGATRRAKERAVAAHGPEILDKDFIPGASAYDVSVHRKLDFVLCRRGLNRLAYKKRCLSIPKRIGVDGKVRLHRLTWLGWTLLRAHRETWQKKWEKRNRRACRKAATAEDLMEATS